MSTQEEGNSTRTFSAAVSGRLAACKLFVIVATLVAFGAMSADLLRPQQTYFLDGPSGEIEVFPLSEPNVTPSSLLKWVTQAVTSIYTLDFYNYNENLESAKQYFTIEGHENYLKALNASGSLNKIINDKLVESAVAIDTAVILQEGIMNNVYSWKIQLPLLLTYQGASTSSTQKTIVVNVLVTRVPTDLAPKGIGIAQIVDEEYYAPT